MAFIKTLLLASLQKLCSSKFPQLYFEFFISPVPAESKLCGQGTSAAPDCSGALRVMHRRDSKLSFQATLDFGVE
jgi:hypothetical protein